MFCIVGCASVAKIERFPQSSTKIEFDRLEKEKMVDDEGIWNLRTDYECFLIVNNSISDVEKQAERALLQAGYSIRIKNASEMMIVGKRGLRANEWNSITGIYYKPKNDTTLIYVKNEITQDITGGWKDNRAKEIGKLLCNKLECLSR